MSVFAKQSQCMKTIMIHLADISDFILSGTFKNDGGVCKLAYKSCYEEIHVL